MSNQEAEATGEFSVHQFFADDTSECVLSRVSAERAVTTAKRLTESVGGRLGTTVRVIITDGGDCTNFEWKFGKGVTYPDRGMLAGRARQAAVTPPSESDRTVDTTRMTDADSFLDFVVTEQPSPSVTADLAKLYARERDAASWARIARQQYDLALERLARAVDELEDAGGTRS